jgi:predicted ATPase
MIPNLTINNEIRKVVPLPEVIGGTRVMLVTGANCSGKSLLRRIIHVRMQEKDCTVWQFSHQLRAHSPFSRVFLGNEDEESTGWITVKNVLKVLGHVEEGLGKPHFFIWDEPEIGLSDESQLGLAQRLTTVFNRQCKNVVGVVFLTHSRIFVQALKGIHSLQWISLDGYETPDAWLEREIKPANLELLKETGRKRWCDISRALDAVRKGT